MRILLVCLITLSALSAQPVLAAEWRSRPLAEIAVHAEYRVPATVVARDEAAVSAEVGGRIVALPWRLGQTVAAGSVLATLDPRSYEIALANAEARAGLAKSQLELAEAQLAQQETLAQRQFVSPDALRIKRTELQVRQRELQAAEQAVAAARLDLARTRITAPFTGVIRQRSASVGDLAAPGMPILRLAATDGVEVEAAVPVEQIDSLQQAAFKELLAGERRIALKLLRISPLVDKAGQTRSVVLAGEGLAPGLAGELRWQDAVLQLPASYVQIREGTRGVWLERNGQPVFEPLPQAAPGRPVALGLPADTRIIDEGRHALGLKAEQ